MKKSLTSQPELPREPQGQKKLFELLDYAYIGARYHDDYKITPQELKYLARCVELLKKQVETSCEEKMESFVARSGREV